jgi:putative FmdB family regulatory protein
MPLYEYACSCGNKFEALRAVKMRVMPCSVCHKSLTPKLSKTWLDRKRSTEGIAPPKGKG